MAKEQNDDNDSNDNGRRKPESTVARSHPRQYRLSTILTVPSISQLVRTALVSKVENQWSDLMMRCGCLPQPNALRMSDLDPTPTEATARATELAFQLVPSSIVEHMVRTYYFGLAVNLWKGRISLGGAEENGDGEFCGEGDAYRDDPFDREAFWVACLLHDVGVSPSLTPKPPSDEEDVKPGSQPSEAVVDADTFFEVRGARRAHEFVTKELDRPFSEERGWLVHEAIALHTSVVEHARGRLEPKGELQGLAWAELLFDGASTDLVASQLGKISPETIRGVLRRHPKGDLHTIFPEIMTAEAAARPCCAIAPHCKMGLFTTIGKSGRKFRQYEGKDGN